MMFILMFAIISNNGNYVTMPSHVDYGHFWFHENNRSYVSYGSPYDIRKLQEDPLSRVPKTHMLSSDSLQTIWLPISSGGIVSPGQFVYNPINERMYIISKGRYLPNIAVCDAQSGSLMSVISTAWAPAAFVYSETSNKLYCANSDDNTIEVIDCQTNQVIETIQLPDKTNALVCSAISNEIYCNQRDNQFIEVIDCATDSLILSIPTGGYPKNLCYNPISNKVYCANSGSLDIIDANSHNIIQNIPLDPASYYLFTLNTINNKVYCINTFSDNVAIISSYNFIMTVLDI